MQIKQQTNLPKLVLGTMTFGEQVEKKEAIEFLTLAKSNGIELLDSAYVYNNGRTELMLGELLSEADFSGFSLATKVHPRIFGNLNYDSVIKQFEESLNRLAVASVDILYLHLPEPNSPIEETLKACHELYKKGLFKRLGLSNYSVEAFSAINKICDQNGWIKPTVYQGLYNAVSRDVETELLPFLEDNNIEFQAFNPLAGGLLAGKYSDVRKTPAAGRFSLRASYRKRYWSDDYFKAVERVKSLSESLGLPLAEAAIRWLINHSKMTTLSSSSVIIGASKVSQLEQNIKAASGGSLPEDLIVAFDDAHRIAEPNSPSYFQSYKA
ncbi:aldo/keto reductase [Idiomarina sp. Sol25]|uniref:aldo/keto reductase family protein n=1 Tax=Idiomarina sp. Sol25 TaxID=3064000 RepID=UPI00294AEF38|nr:aldo/keto reductase [Idiomarina sp. Sol25]MDV6328043.1 aldo/keto reductase [Idiomarina sp. Sol25]